MSFTSSRHYDADVEEVFALFCDPDVVVRRYQAQGDRDIEVVRCEADGDGWVIETRRTVEVDLPGFAAKALKPTNAMTQIDRWAAADGDGTRRGTYEVSVASAPVSTRGSMSLAPDGDGCRHRVEGEIKVKIPVLGGRIAKWSEGTARDTLEAELDFHEGLFDE